MTDTVHINIRPWQCCATCMHSRPTHIQSQYGIPDRKRICAFPGNYSVHYSWPDYWCQKYQLNWFKLRDNVELWLLYLADHDGVGMTALHPFGDDDDG